MKTIWNFLVSVVRAIFHTTPKQTLQPSVDENGREVKPTRTARDIMGKNFFGIEEAMKYFKIKPTEAQLAALAHIPFTAETLEVCKHTHVLVSVFPVSISEIRAMHPHLFRKDIKALRPKGTVTKRADEEAGWYLIRKSANPGAYFDNPKMQQAVLGRNNVIPSARIMVYTIIGDYLMGGKDKRILAYSSIHFDQNSKDRRVVIGPFGKDGLAINYYGTSFRPSHPGICMAKKTEKVLVL